MPPPRRPSADPTPQGPPSFEQALARLEEIVDGLEGGELALEDALARFEEGVGLTRVLGEQLSLAERRVEQLVREGGALVARPLAEGAE